MVKGLNLKGFSGFFRVILQQPHLLLPQVSVKDINEVSFYRLREYGFKGIIFDKDNTLTIPYHNYIAPHLKESLNECKEIFGDRQVVIFSNSAGSNDDPDFKEADKMEKELEVMILRHNTKKPDGIENIKNHFGVEPHELVIIGDRYSTDILFGNTHGLLTIRTDQFTEESESLTNLYMQRIEKRVIELLHSKGTVALSHPLVRDFESILRPK